MKRTAAALATGVFVTLGATGPATADGDEARDDQASQTTSDEARQGDPESTSQDPTSERASKSERDGQAEGQGDERGDGHAPVTVCHLLGNGSYNLLTFDRNALEAHQRHGDLYPVPADGCPESSDDVRPSNDHEHGTPGHERATVCHLLGNGSYNELTFDAHALRAHEAHGDLYPVPADGCPTSSEGVGDEADIAGVDAIAEGDGPSANGEVLGTEQFAGANRSAPQTGPIAGILPQTGAGQLGLAAAAGLGLLAAGGTVLARRRAGGSL